MKTLLKHHYDFKYRDGKLSILVQRNLTSKVYRNVTSSSLTRLVKALNACQHISVDYWVWEK